MKVAAKAMRLRGEQPWGVSSSVRGRGRRSIWMDTRFIKEPTGRAYYRKLNCRLRTITMR